MRHPLTDWERTQIKTRMRGNQAFARDPSWSWSIKVAGRTVGHMFEYGFDFKRESEEEVVSRAIDATGMTLLDLLAMDGVDVLQEVS